MCAIYGALGRYDPRQLEQIAHLAHSRGRDGAASHTHDTNAGKALVGLWRATPTTDIEGEPVGPYEGIVHNGTIANDVLLGRSNGAIDSSVLPGVLDRTRGLTEFCVSLAAIEGSYAIAAVHSGGVYLAANFKPLHFIYCGDAFYFASMAQHLIPVTPYGVAPVTVGPYGAVDLATGETLALPRAQPEPVLIIASGGLDSTVVATMYKAHNHDVTLLHFDYGCHATARESVAIDRIAQALKVKVARQTLDYSALRGDSPLFADAPVADAIAGAEFAHEWVPARNLVMIAHAVAYAEANGFGTVALGANLEEAGAYPDNEEQFALLMDKALDYAVGPHRAVRIATPIGHLMKHEIVRTGLSMNAPLQHTWSCYGQGDRHCGQCGPCFMRRTAFERCGAVDPVFAPTT